MQLSNSQKKLKDILETIDEIRDTIESSHFHTRLALSSSMWSIRNAIQNLDVIKEYGVESLSSCEPELDANNYECKQALENIAKLKSERSSSSKKKKKKEVSNV